MVSAPAGLLRRTTIVCRSIEQSLRFWCAGLGYVVWYDGEMATWDEPGWGYPPSSRVRVVVVHPPDDPADPPVGMVGLVSLLDGDPPPLDRGDDGLLRLGETVLLVNTDAIDAAYRRLVELGFAPGPPRPLEAPGHGVVWEMPVRDPDGVAVTLVQQQAPEGRPS